LFSGKTEVVSVLWWGWQWCVRQDRDGQTECLSL